MTLLLKEALSNGHATIASRFAEPRPLIDAVLHAVEVHRPLAAERDIDLEVEFSPRLVLSEAGPLFTVLSNGIRNAIEAVGRGGRVLVAAELVRNGPGYHEVQIDVVDDGPGPPEEAWRVFSLDYTTKRHGPGVGLALSKAILEEMGGEISLEGREDGVRGARLRIRYREEHA
jgi:signal transduction histidine kinase